MTIEDLRPSRMRLKASYVLGFLVVVMGIALVGTIYYYATSPGEATRTRTTTRTIYETRAATVTTPRVGKVLVSYSGSGDGNSPPFTATTSTVKVTLRVKSTAPSVEYTLVSWYIHEVGKKASTCHGDVDKQEGTFEQYGYNLEPGKQYYVSIISASAKWDITVKES